MLFSLALLPLGLASGDIWPAQVASACLGLVLLVRALWKLTRKAARRPFSGPAAAGAPQLEKEVAALAAALFGIHALEFIGSQSDRILLGIYLNAREVDICSVAASIVAMVGFFFNRSIKYLGPRFPSACQK